MSRKNVILTIFVLWAVMLLCGCGETLAQKRKQMAAKFDKSAVTAKIPAIQNMLAEGRITEAENELKRCFAIDPNNPEVNLLAGKLELINGHEKQAEKHFLKAVNFNSNLDEAWYGLGVIAGQDNRHEDAFEHIERAVELKPLNTDYIILKAQCLSQSKKTDEAIEFLNEKSSLLNLSWQLKAETGRIYRQIGQTEKAITAFLQAMLISSESALDVLEPLGYCYIAQGDWKKALETFEKLYNKTTEQEKQALLRVVGMCAMNSGEYGKALVYYDKLSVSERENPDVWLEMAKAALGIGNADRAKSCASKATALKPGWTEASLVTGSACYMKKEYGKAVEIFRTITTDEVHGGFAWFMVGRCYQQMNRESLAKEAYAKAVKMNPDSPTAEFLKNINRTGM